MLSEMLWLQRFGLGIAMAGLVCAQAPPAKRESVVVTGSYEPMPLEEADRSVRLIEVKGLELLANTFIDFLKLDSSLDLRARGPNGVQTDLGIRGGTFGQTLVLLDGQRMNDAQSGHHNMDLPVPLEAVERIEVLRGAGSTLYGADAMGGVINVISRTDAEGPRLDVRLRTGVGNFGTNQQRGSVGMAGRAWSERLTFTRDFSTGFMRNRDYRVLSFGSATHGKTRLGSTDVTLGYADKPFGAEQFYGNFNSWEDTKTWFAGLRQELGEKTEASLSFRRHSDLFVLYRDRPQVYHNHHSVESWQGSLRRRETLGANAKLYYGAEGFRDAIESNNLGRHDRARGAGYASLDVRALKRFSFTAGAREETYGAGRHQFSPSVSAGAWVTPRIKVRGGVSRAFRLPTYTDLFYRDPANVGNPLLRPERAWSYEGAVDWTAGPVRGEVVVFQRRETDGIDYVRASAVEVWRAANIHELRFTGVEASVKWRVKAQVFDLRYTGLRGAEKALGGLQSKYVFNYPSQSAVAAWQGAMKGGVIARVRVGALKRLGRDPYGLVDVYVAQTRWRVRPFVQFTNLTGAVYQEIVGVAMPGRGVVGGVEVAVWGR